ncbi:PAS domain-containing sensor histidine kinase, partial [Halorubrum distributum]
MTLRPSDTPAPGRGADEGDVPETDAPETDDHPAAGAATGDAERPARSEESEAGAASCAPADSDRASGDVDATPAEGWARPVEPDRFLLAVAVDGEVLFAGPSVPDVVGVERDGLVGSDLLDRVHPSDRDPVADALSAVATSR